MKILLLGKNGQLGWELQRSLAPLGELTALGSDSRDPCGDLRDLDGLADTVRLLSPDVIVNAAAYTAVDRAESDVESCRTVNALAPGVLARVAASSGALLVHYSTDYVFDGSGERLWTESDPTGPLSVYGKTKLEGEQAIVASACRHLIFRTSWVYAARGGNFAKTMLRLAAERERLSVVDDQIGAPTGADLLADVSAHAIRAMRGHPELGGIYHLAAAGHTSWHGYASFVIEQARQAGVDLKVGPGAIEAVASNAFPSPAPRPKNSRLDLQKVQQAFDLTLPDWRIGVSRMLTEFLEK
ncbi:MULTISPECIES: dTDP-4-dehydrorhamnose reductase [unclassified Janthinobacterium]|uniref:dTDP-4-dehydrorhamnose reductase n=1 Tax=unclassified Janthinobacterium TaxID=2610881 RepID=UPI0017A1FAD5|nr:MULTISPECIES: dTDP-4-dehydrorhamnose reductase [unclassified Janthinobacterium]MBB5608036.1 dTDP-4-dehydrorhamnose reductase [Janthinobacterium sp. S3T4]MBB5613223.1 dTDP-4-dehydrorhamnose reductase [Janthinobacterium sp. S3M3]